MGGCGAVFMCFMCLCRLTLLFASWGVLAYSCVAYRCTPFICLLSVVSWAKLEKQINGLIDASDYLFGAAEARPDVCPAVSLGTLWLTACMSDTHTHAPFCNLCVCKFVPKGPFNSVSISSFTLGSWMWSGTRATLPTQHQKLLMSYCCTLLWNIIALWCVNKAGACCHSICSPAGQTGTTSWGKGRWGGRSREKTKARGSGWSV